MFSTTYIRLQPKNAKLMENVAIAGRNAIKAFSGRFYRVGSISHITKRKIAGSVVDYAYGAVKVPLTLVMELPSTEYGFQPPTDKIHPLGVESWQGIREMCKTAFSLKAKIHEDEKSQDDKSENGNYSSTTLKLAGNCIEQDINNDKDIGKFMDNKTNNNTFTCQIIQKQMSKGVISSILDATF